MTLLEDKNVFDLIIDGIPLTLENLNNNGIDHEDIDKLIDDGSLTKTAGCYILINTKKLFHYGKHLIAMGDRDRAEKCFEICYRVDPRHPAVNFQMFLKFVLLNDFDRALKFLENLLNVEVEFYARDAKLYEYLLSFLTDMEPDRVEKICSYSYEELTVLENDKRYSDGVAQNKIIYDIFQGRFSHALSLLKDTVELKGHITAREIVLRALIKRARQAKRKEQRELYDLVLGRKFKEAKVYLERMKSKHPLSKIDRYILIILEKIEDLEKKKTDISIKPTKCINFFEAIENGNFPWALSLLKVDEEKYDKIFRILLEEVNKKIIEYGGNEMDRISRYLSDADMYGVAMIEIFSPQEAEKINEIVYSFCNTDLFPVEYEGRKYLVFRNEITVDANISLTLNGAISNSLETQDYDTALELAKMQVESPLVRRYEDYLTLGDIYREIGDVDIARECYIASFGLCDDENIKQNIDQKIKALKPKAIDGAKIKAVYADSLEDILGEETEQPFKL